MAETLGQIDIKPVERDRSYMNAMLRARQERAQLGGLPEIIPLDEAVLCVDCNSITRLRFDHCAACGSHSILKLVEVIGWEDAAEKRAGKKISEYMSRAGMSLEVSREPE